MPAKDIETTRLSEIVLEMLANNIPDEEIIVNLQQSGLTKQKAQQVLEKAKEGFKEFTGKRIDAIIEKKLSERLDEKIEKIRKEQTLQSDLKFIEHKKYIDKISEGVRAEVASLKSEVGDIRIGTEAALKGVLREMDTLKVTSSTQRYLSIGLVIGGIFSCILFFIYTPQLADYLFKRKPFDTYTIIITILTILFVIVAFICFSLAGRVYVKSKKKLGEIHPWVSKEKPPKDLDLNIPVEK